MIPVNKDLSDALLGFAVKVVISVVLALLIMGGFALFGHHIVWWGAAMLGFALVFGVWEIATADDDWIS